MSITKVGYSAPHSVMFRGTDETAPAGPSVVPVLSPTTGQAGDTAQISAKQVEEKKEKTLVEIALGLVGPLLAVEAQTHIGEKTVKSIYERAMAKRDAFVGVFKSASKVSDEQIAATVFKAYRGYFSRANRLDAEDKMKFAAIIHAYEGNNDPSQIKKIGRDEIPGKLNVLGRKKWNEVYVPRYIHILKLVIAMDDKLAEQSQT